MKTRIINWAHKTARLSACDNKPLSRILASIQYANYKKGKPIPGIDVDALLQTFVPEEKRADGDELARIVKEMLYCRYYYQIGGKEYFLYHFSELTDKARKQYVGFYELMGYYEALNATGRPEVFANKELTYETFQSFFHREVLCCYDQSGKEAFLRFLEKYRACIFKPLNRYGGKGIRRLEITETQDAESLYAQVQNRMPFVLEELIDQDPGIAALHPQSVNTVRYLTFYYHDKLYRIQAVLRIGQGDSTVDNATSGGVYALIDVETGVLKGPARSFLGECCETHPDTGIRFEGFQIPRWDELNELLEQVARVLPEQKQVGWDFALSKTGWVLVEGNTMPGIVSIQSSDLSHGLRRTLADTFGQAIRVKQY